MQGGSKRRGLGIKRGEREGERLRDGRIVRETNNPDCKSHSLWSLRADQERWTNGLIDEMEGRTEERGGGNVYGKQIEGLEIEEGISIYLHMYSVCYNARDTTAFSVLSFSTPLLHFTTSLHPSLSHTQEFPFSGSQATSYEA